MTIATLSETSLERPDSDFGEGRCWRLAIPKGPIVYGSGDPATAFYRVEEGCIRLQLMGAWVIP